MGERVFGGHVATYRKCSIPLKFKKCDFFLKKSVATTQGKPCLVWVSFDGTSSLIAWCLQMASIIDMFFLMTVQT